MTTMILVLAASVLSNSADHHRYSSFRHLQSRSKRDKMAPTYPQPLAINEVFVRDPTIFYDHTTEKYVVAGTDDKRECGYF